MGVWQLWAFIPSVIFEVKKIGKSLERAHKIIGELLHLQQKTAQSNGGLLRRLVFDGPWRGWRKSKEEIRVQSVDASVWSAPWTIDRHTYDACSPSSGSKAHFLNFKESALSKLPTDSQNQQPGSIKLLAELSTKANRFTRELSYTKSFIHILQEESLVIEWVAVVTKQIF